MTFRDALDEIRNKIEQHGDQLDNEEITKHVLILPMLEALGYDYRDPTEVRAEYPVALPGGGKGRADYVVMRNGEPAMVIECKAAGVIVDESVSDQMREYANALGVHVGVATNGIGYSCFADVETAGEMDAEPYCFANASFLTDDDEQALALLAKENFSPEGIRQPAQRHKQELEWQWRADAFVWAPSAQSELYRIAELRGESERQREVSLLNDKITERIHVAVETIALHGGSANTDDDIQTTGDELDAYSMVKGMLHGVIAPSRVDFRDRITYASVLIDNNNRKPICRFHFNGRQKYLGTFDAEKKESRHAIDSVDDIIGHAAALRRTARRYADG